MQDLLFPVANVHTILSFVLLIKVEPATYDHA